MMSWVSPQKTKGSQSGSIVLREQEEVLMYADNDGKKKGFENAGFAFVLENTVCFRLFEFALLGLVFVHGSILRIACFSCIEANLVLSSPKSAFRSSPIIKKWSGKGRFLDDMSCLYQGAH